MSRIRTIKPEFFADPKIGALSFAARLLYIGLWTLADEAGNCPGDARVIRANVFPFEEDSGTVTGALRELEAAGRLRPYAVNGETYYHLPTLARHQLLRPDRRTFRYPPPAEGAESVGPTPGGLREDSGRTPAGPGPGPGPGPVREGVPEGRGGDRPSGPSPPAASPSISARTERGPNADPARTGLSHVEQAVPGLRGDNPPTHPVALFVLACAARKGSPWAGALPATGPEWDEWAKVHDRVCPAVDLKATVAEAYAWSLRSGPRGRKRDLRRFLGGWFTREQDKIGREGEGGRAWRRD